MDESPWYVEFFRRDYYRAFAPRLEPERTEGEVEFVVRALDLEPGASVLDFCCGHGRHSIPLAECGYNVTGLDLSAYHLRLARRAARDAGVSIRWLRRDMRDIRAEGAYNAVIQMFSAFGYFESDDEHLAVLQGVSRALKPGGRYLLDTTNRDWIVRNFRETDWRGYEDGSFTLERRRFDLLAGRIETEWMLVEPRGQRRQHLIHFRLYTLAELARMLGLAGLTVIQTWGDFEGHDYGLDSRRLIVLAEKAAAS